MKLSPQNPSNGADPTRLNKAIATRVGCSRRKADEFILAGVVKINGAPEQNPARRVGQDDLIEIDGVKYEGKTGQVYLMLNKPVHCVCTMHDPQGRQTVAAFIPEAFKDRHIFPVGRLDYFSEGLLLLTSDGNLANQLAHPRYGHEKIYEVLIRGPVNANALAVMRSGMSLSTDLKLLPVKVKSKSLDNGNTLLRLALRQGVNRQIRRMCEKLGLTILKLRRIKEAGLELGNLGVGKIRLLNEDEVKKLEANHCE